MPPVSANGGSHATYNGISWPIRNQHEFLHRDPCRYLLLRNNWMFLAQEIYSGDTDFFSSITICLMFLICKLIRLQVHKRCIYMYNNA